MGELSFREKALQLTKANVVKGRTSRGGIYLVAFVAVMAKANTEESGLTRLEIISDISAKLAQEKYEADGGFDFENPEHLDDFSKINKKVKAQVAAIVSKSQNNTSLAYNPLYKDKYELHEGVNEKGKVIYMTTKESVSSEEEE